MRRFVVVENVNGVVIVLLLIVMIAISTFWPTSD
jgi:hypothetical protein